MILSVQPTALREVLLLVVKRHRDERGFFEETWNRRVLAKHGIAADFVQSNLAASRKPGTLRGLHYQIPPAEQGKLVGVVQGAIQDVVVDVRRRSAHFGQHTSVRLSADDGRQIWVPPGFAHGYCTLEPGTIVSYAVTAYWAPALERGLRWDDPELNIAWQVPGGGAVVSPRDQSLPLLGQASELPDLADDFAGR